jgi:hypothetical protein
MDKTTITIPVELEGMEAAQQSAAQLVEKLKEAKTLTDALASDMEKLQPKAPKVDAEEIDEDRFWECVARFFVAAYESRCSHKPVTGNETCGSCPWLPKCAIPHEPYWMEVNRVLRKKTGIGCQIARSFKDSDE